jgi:hypothetical protein
MNLFSRPDIHINLEGLNEQAFDLAKKLVKILGSWGYELAIN